jgi:hypothetical protein
VLEFLEIAEAIGLDPGGAQDGGEGTETVRWPANPVDRFAD